MKKFLTVVGILLLLFVLIQCSRADYLEFDSNPGWGLGLAVFCRHPGPS